MLELELGPGLMRVVLEVVEVGKGIVCVDVLVHYLIACQLRAQLKIWIEYM